MTSEATWADKSRTVSDDRSRLSGTETEVSGFGKNTSPASRQLEMRFRPKTAGRGDGAGSIDTAGAGLGRCPRAAPCSRETHGRQFPVLCEAAFQGFHQIDDLGRFGDCTRRCRQVSSGGELRPSALSVLCVKLSLHTAPIRQTRRSFQCASVRQNRRAPELTLQGNGQFGPYAP